MGWQDADQEESSLGSGRDGVERGTERLKLAPLEWNFEHMGFGPNNNKKVGKLGKRNIALG